MAFCFRAVCPSACGLRPSLPSRGPRLGPRLGRAAHLPFGQAVHLPRGAVLHWKQKCGGNFFFFEIVGCLQRQRMKVKGGCASCVLSLDAFSAETRAPGSWEREKALASHLAGHFVMSLFFLCRGGCPCPRRRTLPLVAATTAAGQPPRGTSPRPCRSPRCLPRMLGTFMHPLMDIYVAPPRLWRICCAAYPPGHRV